MEDAKAAGLTKAIGVSNFRIQDLEAILPTATVVPAVNQIEFHPYVYDSEYTISDHNYPLHAHGSVQLQAP